ncbi:sugar phosphate permease [Sporomusaceae bacterium BoRhaA]|uniref:MFS transporter n=1 Tax=Pelorhabdus rhamnosifermentans TaxID=2772457 RepID=UPI001C06176F|nr:MFS transporter [Pelorhabdus rhamnosifermentans]MBU2702750.1 sugar phosphate permease [Pelorhabdus rhamnosifermentans]
MLNKSNYRWLILGVCMLVYCTAELVRWNYTGISKYLVVDWNIGKPELGILGSVFFYSYAIGQIPWGTATDIFGGRRVIPIGIGTVALCMVGFAYSNSFYQAVAWRTVMGFMAAAAFIPSASLLNKWFSKHERGFVMQMFSGAGGGLGEAMTFLLMPVFAILLAHGGTFAGLGGWHGATLAMACIVFMIAVIAIVFLRSDPSDIGLVSVQKQEDGAQEQGQSYFSVAKAAVTSLEFWNFAMVWSGFTVGTRLVPAWLVMYATDFYLQSGGMSKEAAMIAGGTTATIYVLGRAVGTPVVGLISDVALKHGIHRSVVIWIAQVAMICMYFSYTFPIFSPLLLNILAFISGILINLFPLMNAVGAELWSIRTSGMLMGMVNTFGQFMGAVMLTLSGFMAARFSIVGGAFYTEFLGIWYLGIIYSVIASLAATYFVYKNFFSKKRVTENSMN